MWLDGNENSRIKNNEINLPEEDSSEEGTALDTTFRGSLTPTPDDDDDTPTAPTGTGPVPAPAPAPASAAAAAAAAIPGGATTGVVTVGVSAVAVAAGSPLILLFFTSMIASIAKEGVHIQYLSFPQ